MVRIGTTLLALIALVVLGTSANAGVLDFSAPTALLASGNAAAPSVSLVQHHRGRGHGYGGHGYGGHGYGGHGYGGYGHGGPRKYYRGGYGVPAYRPTYGYGGGYGVPSCGRSYGYGGGYGGYGRGIRGGVYIGF